MSEPENEPIGNDALNKLAGIAKSEDRTVDEDEVQVNESTGDIETKEEQKESAEENAEKAATVIINSAAWLANKKWDIEYPDEMKDEGVQKVKPCLLGEGEPPAWLIGMLGRYGKYIEAGAFFAGAAFVTYQFVQENKEDGDTESTARESQSSESAYAVSGVDGQRQVASAQTAITDT